MKYKTRKEIAEDAAMIAIGSAFALHMSDVLLVKANTTVGDLLLAIYRMPSDLWNAGNDSAFCALGIFTIGIGLAMSGWAFLSNYLESKGIKLKDLLKDKNPYL